MNQSLTFAYPGDLELRTGGYGYDREIIRELRHLGWDVTLLPLGDGFPSPSRETLGEAERQISALEDGTLVVIDGLAFGVMDEWAAREGDRLRIIALVHHPLALETGISAERQAQVRQSETKALSAVRHILVTSPMTAGELKKNFGVSGLNITVALPGTVKPPASDKVENDIPQILSVGSLTRRKGHDILISALATVRELDWCTTIIGSPHLDPEVADSLDEQIRMLNLSSRVVLAGESDDLTAAYVKADIFALASRYEGYGMVFAEALSHGLPIVACKAGAVPDVVPSEAGLLVPVDDVEAIASALRLLLTDRRERDRRAEAAGRAGALLPGWEDTANIISTTLKELA
ncbi:glycosyltransferase involved in cell wall biosynthesis [Rhizobium skierniewicense]|uniref:Glycosyltransferase involved in cell wall biosynthesis n=1 Tax=Rhizobium skierniewicense TaxID=984260 RepID=A0A7W6CE46_9HYPH|nr:glycosyltransferase family 4 protein [Rhizobium skierniewicense]MBB3948628.1 glycosyltransferase involved in cell wall biosynthesis [Rhizobium skierniewicense]